ncbi:ATP-binding cassette domain-containing protein [Candidatus Bathyarchaeota archaeon]|nr:ATP-binding cassette domain-containing protein [Candidatus Bathyarchaeota archaeon]
MGEDTVITVSGLTKRYGSLLAVDHVDFQVKEGEIFGFLGPNGAGKTTTIRILTGLSNPTSGSAHVLDYDIDSDIAEVKKQIGVVPELSSLYDELSAIDNLLFMAKLYGVPRDQRKERAEQLLKMFRLYERRNDPFATLSRGMRRALTIAAALVHSPRLLFLDEPTVDLDVVAARSLRSLITDLRRQDITIFLTTHYLEEADALCDRIAILVKGRIVKLDTPEAIKSSVGLDLPVEISLAAASQKFVEEVSAKLPNLQVVPVNNKVRILGGRPAEVLEVVLHSAKHAGVEVNAVTTVRPNLEDAFIKITGLEPIMMAVEKGDSR